MPREGGEGDEERQAAAPAPDGDLVDHVVAAWHRQRPDLDASGKQVTGRVARLYGLFEREFQADYATDGLDAGSFAVLAALRRVGRPFTLTPTELNRELLISSAGVTHLVDRLQSRRLVTRRPDRRDRRQVHIVLTPAGREVADRAMSARAATERRLVSGLNEAECGQLAALLRRLVLSLDTPPAERPRRGGGRPPRAESAGLNP